MTQSSVRPRLVRVLPCAEPRLRSSFLGSRATCRSRPWCPSHHCERIWRGHGAQGQGIQKMGPKKYRIGMQHIQINKNLQYQTLAHLRHITLRAMPRSLQKIMSLGHSHASGSLASRAWRKISGIADCARAGVLVSFLSPSHASFRCILLPPLLIPASALRSVAKVWVAARHGGVLPLSLISEQLVEPCFGHRSPLQTHPRHRTFRQGLTPCLLHF